MINKKVLVLEVNGNFEHIRQLHWRNAVVDLIENYHNAYGIFRFILDFFYNLSVQIERCHMGGGLRKANRLHIYGESAKVKEVECIQDFVKDVVVATTSEYYESLYDDKN